MTATHQSTELALFAPVAGRVVALENVTDPAFAAGVLGPGLAIVPMGGTILAPVSGTVVAALPHAYGLMTDEGVEILVHIGIDTVQLEGAHFSALVEVGQRVVAGHPLVQVDLAAVAAAGYDTSTVVLVTGWKSAQGVRVVAEGSVTPADVLLMVTV